MLAGVQLSDGLKLEAIADGGFSYAEIPYEIIEKNESQKDNSRKNLIHAIHSRYVFYLRIQI